MMDLKSILGYSQGSPFANSSFLDIHTPEGLIDMSNTPMDLIGIDNKGNKKKMKANSKNPYKFEGDMVREMPINPYQQGGMTKQKIFDFLFSEDEQPKETTVNVPTAPSTEEVAPEQDPREQQRQIDNQQNDEMVMAVLNQDRSSRGNPYGDRTRIPSMPSGNPYTGDILSSGQHGSENIGEYGRQIYGDLTQSLGYKPVVNSIFRDKAQNDALIAAGAPAVKNSWHLSGNAIDLKLQDWHNLSDEKQLYFRKNYDVIYHNNHYHIEPK